VSTVLKHNLFSSFLSVSVNFVERDHSIKVLSFFTIGIKQYGVTDSNDTNWFHLWCAVMLRIPCQWMWNGTVYPQKATKNL